jgi:peptidoglycan hydrolase CwlO-like protein
MNLKRAGDAFDKELKDTDSVLEPTRRELADAEERVAEMYRKIAQTKSAVAKNDARIQELVRMVVFK